MSEEILINENKNLRRQLSKLDRKVFDLQLERQKLKEEIKEMKTVINTQQQQQQQSPEGDSPGIA